MFPFYYGGQTFTTCTCIDFAVPWCSLTADARAGYQGVCTGSFTSDNTCASSSGAAVGVLPDAPVVSSQAGSASASATAGSNSAVATIVVPIVVVLVLIAVVALVVRSRRTNGLKYKTQPLR